MKQETFEKMQAMMKNFSKEQLEKIIKIAKKMVGMSEHFNWGVEWVIETYNSAEFKELGPKAIPFSTQTIKENIVLDLGAEQLLKLLGGVDGATAYSNANAKIFVGSSTTAENASQTGIITSLGNASMDATYPQVSGRNIVFRGTFEEGVATGDWREICIYNGTGSGAVALNRKTQNMGTKAEGQTTVVQATISVISV